MGTFVEYDEDGYPVGTVDADSPEGIRRTQAREAKLAARAARKGAKALWELIGDIGPKAALEALQVGESVLLSQYQITPQVSPTVWRIGKLSIPPRKFTCRAQEGGVRVTRLV